MAMLPEVGARAVILGMSAFNSNARTVTAQLNQIGQASYYLERNSSRAFAGVSAGATSMFGVITTGAALAAGAMASMATAATIMATRYADGVNFMGAISESTVEQTQQLSRTQLELSRVTTTSAMGLTEMSTELLKAGFETEQLTGKTLAAVNALAVASRGELSAADAAILAQVATSNFRIAHDDLAIAADAATAAVQRSTLNFSGYATAIRTAGGTAANAGLNINEFSAAVGVMGQVISQGSVVGTGLRSMFDRLQDPTEENIKLMKQYGISLYDAQGVARPFRDVIISLESAFGDAAVAQGKLTQAQRDQALAQLFERRGAQAVIALIRQGVDEYDRMLEATQRLSASGLAGRVMLSTAAAVQMLKNNVAALAISFGTGLDPAINAITTRMLNFLQSINLDNLQAFGEWIGTHLYTAVMQTADIIGAFAGQVADLFDVLADIGQGSAFLQFLGSVFKWSLSVALALNNLVENVMIRMAANAIPFLVTSIEALGEVIVWLEGAIASSAAAMVATWNAGVAAIGNAINVAITAFFDMLGALADTAAHSQQVWAFMVNVALHAAGSIGGPVVSGITFALQAIANASGTMAQNWDTAWSAMGSIVGRAVAWIAGRINAFLDALSSLPIIGEAIGGIRAAIGNLGGTLGRMGVTLQHNITNAASAAGTAIQQMGANLAGLPAMLDRAFPLPPLKDYGAELRDITSKLRAVQDAAARKPGSGPRAPILETEPGSFPDDGDAGRAAKKAAQDAANATEKANELIKDLLDDIEKEHRKVSEQVTDLWEKASAEMEKSTEDWAEGVVKAIQEASDAALELDMSRAIRGDADARRGNLEQTLGEETKAFEKARDDQEVIHNRELEDTKSRLSAERDIRVSNLEWRLDQEADARERLREDEDAIYAKSLDAQRENLDKQLDQAVRAFDKILDAEEDSLEARHDAEEKVLRRQHDTRKQALDDQLELLKRALDDEIRAVEDALDRRLEAEENALERAQQQREDALKARHDAERALWDDERALAEISAEEQADRAKAQAEYTAEIARGVKQSIALSRLNEKVTGITERADTARSRVTDRRRDAEEEAAFEAIQNAELLALKDEFEQESLALEQEHDLARHALDLESRARRDALDREARARTLALQAELDAELLVMRDEHERQITALREEHERRRDEIEAEHERQRRALDERLQKESLARQRKREDEDRQYREEQQATLRSFNAAEDAKALRAQRKLEDTERARALKLDEEAQEFRTDQDERRRNLERILDQEEHDRKLGGIYNERDERLRVLDETLAEDQRKTREKLAQDVLDLIANMDERIAVIRERYMDRLEDVLRDGGATLNPLVNEITDNMAAGLDKVREAAIGMTEALTKAIGAEDALREAQSRRAATPGVSDQKSKVALDTGSSGDFDWGKYNFEKNMGATEAQARERASRQYGGVVPGPFGAPVPIIAHGGEMFEGMGGYSMGLTAVRMAEAMAARGIGTGSHIVNQYDYTVHANYGNVQPEGSVRRDLSALVALTRG